jgi:hypothetical protein
MDNTIYTSYLNRVTSSNVIETTFDNIFSIIQSEQYGKEITEIRNEPDDQEQKKLKRENLPVFFPTLVFGSNYALDEQTDTNGIVQFDVDAKDNIGLDFSVLRQQIQVIPETCYLFTSPTGGLKFGIKTDFNRHIDEDEESFKSRYSIAYGIVNAYLEEKITDFNIEYDKAVGNLKWSCLLTYDVDVYFNPECVLFPVDQMCFYVKPEPRLSSSQPEDASQVVYLLSNISKDLDYDDRLKVNSVVIDALGHSAIAILETHWSTENRKKLSKDLEDQFKKSGNGRFKASLGILVNFAKANGWIPTSGAARNKLVAQQSTNELAPLLSPEEATIKLKDIIESFIVDKQSRFINFSTGAGKTETILQVLEEIARQSRIMYLVKSHELAEEIIKRFRSIKEERNINLSPLERFKRQQSQIYFLKGRKYLCENDDVNKSLVTTSYCTNDCIYNAECEYTEQFHSLQNIRVMTHNEYVNKPSAFSNGVDAEGNPRKGTWLPDYLIIDEDIFTVEVDYSEANDSRFDVVSKIISTVQSGLELKDAILANQADIFLDAVKNKKNKPQSCLINAAKKVPEFKFSELFYNITQYAKTEELSYLNGMRVKNSKIIQSVIKSVAERYQSTPTLFLDATANESVISRLLPNVEYHSINVKSKNDINLYQLQNKSFSSNQLTKDGLIEEVIFGLRKLTEKYTENGKSVGLITYKTNRDLTKNTAFDDFDAFLANEIGVDDFAHFGGLRGLNKFDDMDCLIIVGRYCLPVGAIESHTWAIFNEAGENWTEDCKCYLDSPVRMKDGSTFSLNSQIMLNDKTRAVSEHYSLSETQQAIGRGRLIHGKAKDIYYLSNEYLGSNIEVTGFLSYNDLFSREIVDPDYKIIDPVMLEALKVTGFFKDTQVGMMEVLNLTKAKVQDNEDRIIRELLDAGFTRQQINYKDFNRKNHSTNFYVKNDQLLMEYLNPKMKKFISLIAI